MRKRSNEVQKLEMCPLQRLSNSTMAWKADLAPCCGQKSAVGLGSLSTASIDCLHTSLTGNSTLFKEGNVMFNCICRLCPAGSITHHSLYALRYSRHQGHTRHNCTCRYLTQTEVIHYRLRIDASLQILTFVPTNYFPVNFFEPYIPCQPILYARKGEIKSG